jgi:hypothetical protein
MGDVYSKHPWNYLTKDEPQHHLTLVFDDSRNAKDFHFSFTCRARRSFHFGPKPKARFMQHLSTFRPLGAGRIVNLESLKWYS